MPGTEEWILIVVVIVILFGSTQLPKLARALGGAKGEFNKAKREFDEEARRAESGTTPPASVSESDIRTTARNLGIDDAGKSTDDLKRLIQEKLA